MKKMLYLMISAALILTAISISAPSNGELETEERIWTPAGWEYRITTDEENDDDPDISGNRIVYISRQTGRNEVYLYDINNETESRIPIEHNGIGEPRIWGDRIVFSYHDGYDYEIYLFYIKTWSGIKITDDDIDQSNPDIHDQHVVYSHHLTGNTDTYWYNISSEQTTPLETDPSSSLNPRIHYPYVVWEEVHSSDYHVGIHYLITGSTFNPTRGLNEELSDPDIFDNIIVYSARMDGGAREEIRFMDLYGGLTRYIEPTSSMQRSPSVYGNRIVWTNDGHRSNLMVYDVDKDLIRMAAASYQAKSSASIWGDRIVYNQYVEGNRDIYLVELDLDHDGVSDSKDLFMDNPNEHSDLDGDGIGDNTDPDSDNDGYLNVDDDFPMDITEWSDFDNDDIGDNADTDDDNDGIPDIEDSEPLNPLNSVMERIADLMYNFNESSNNISARLSALEDEILGTYSDLNSSLRDQMASDLQLILAGLGMETNQTGGDPLGNISDGLEMLGTRIEELTEAVNDIVDGSDINTTQLQEVLGYLEDLQELQEMVDDIENLNEQMDEQSKDIQDSRKTDSLLSFIIILLILVITAAVAIILLKRRKPQKDNDFE